ncbi:hypothetical protein C5L14_19135 [Labrys okinawensis]|uniref:Uncharacterized protein n=1 Tax=Labrys okinawensis TaxID=346911 RepID=A0A2S9Q8P1_9HYPH|nr:hypothetical protein C5L14_19135 [Labrys okinawensis]
MKDGWAPGAQGEQGNGNPAEGDSPSVKVRSRFDGQTFGWMCRQGSAFQPPRDQERERPLRMVDSARAVRRQQRMKLAVLRKSRFAVARQADGRQHLTAFLQARLEKDRTMSANTNLPG